MSAPRHSLPQPDAVGRIVGMLIDKVVRVVKARVRHDLAAKSSYVALYVDDAGVEAIACLADPPLIATLGAALAMIPPAVAAEVVKSGEMTELLLANSYEVLNILAVAFNEVGPHAGHVKLSKVRPAAELPLVFEAVRKATSRLDVDVTVPAYANGKLAVALLSL